MAEQGKGGGSKKIRGSNKAGQLRALYAKGVLGKGKGGKTKYNKKRGKTLRNLKSKGIDVRAKYRNTPSGSTRPVIGGSKAAGLRSGAGSGGASKPTKAQRDSTRAERIEAGKAQAAYGVVKQASRRKASQYVKDAANQGYVMNAQSSAAARAQGFQSTKEAAKLIQGQQTIPRARRIAKGRKVLEQFRASQEAKNQAAYGGGLFAPKAPTPKPKPDYSSTRAARVAAGKAVLKKEGLSKRPQLNIEQFARLTKGKTSADTFMHAQEGLRSAPTAKSAQRRRQAGFNKLADQRDATERRYNALVAKGKITRPGTSITDRQARVMAGKAKLAEFGKSPRGQSITKAVRQISDYDKVIAERTGTRTRKSTLDAVTRQRNSIAASVNLRPGAVAKLLKRLNR